MEIEITKTRIVSFFVGLFCIFGKVDADDFYPPMYPEITPFENALAKIPPIPQANTHDVTGIVVPHHLPAADLMALGFRAAAHKKFKRVILLTPDHFKRSTTPIATTRRGFNTSYGKVNIDQSAVEGLLAGKSEISESELFAQEHGIHSLLPFIAKLLPDASLVPIAIRIDSKEQHWLPLIHELEPLFDDSTLIVQSTDFSHYLNVHQAKIHDQETLHTLALKDTSAAASLSQPAHIDSRAAQYVHMALQHRLGHCGHSIIANRNSQNGSFIHQPETTSYIVQVFEKIQTHAWPIRKGEEIWYFGGDTFLGRYVAPLLSKPERYEEILGKITQITQGAPMIVNLEGILLPKVPDPRAQRTLLMQQDIALKFLKALNVRAVSLANNHSLDAGQSGLNHTAEFLTKNGIQIFKNGETIDLGKFRVFGLTDINNQSFPQLNRLSKSEVTSIIATLQNDKPTIAFLHWGEEWKPEILPRQQNILNWLTEPIGAKEVFNDGVKMTIQAQPTSLSLIIGTHPHVASPSLKLPSQRKFLVAPSLGNLIFDQPKGNGALLEIRFFPSGTHATRLVPIGNILSSDN